MVRENCALTLLQMACILYFLAAAEYDPIEWAVDAGMIAFLSKSFPRTRDRLLGQLWKLSDISTLPSLKQSYSTDSSRRYIDGHDRHQLDTGHRCVTTLHVAMRICKLDIAEAFVGAVRRMSCLRHQCLLWPRLRPVRGSLPVHHYSQAVGRI